MVRWLNGWRVEWFRQYEPEPAKTTTHKNLQNLDEPFIKGKIVLYDKDSN
jgi:hypothetical protein